MRVAGLFISLFISILGYGQTTPKYSNEFLSIGVGARALGMSGTQIAIVDDVTAGYWNPAGLLNVKDQHQGALMHAEYFAGIAKYDYLGYATKLDSTSALGLSVIRFAIDDIPDTRFLYDANGAIDYNRIRFFSAADYAFIMSYARKLSWLKGIDFGGNFKIIHRKAGDFASAWGFGLDAGMQKQIKKWQLGLMVTDVTGTFNAWSHNQELVADVYTQTGNELPENALEVTLPKAILGIARSFKINDNFTTLLALDLVSTFDGKRNVLIRSEAVSVDPSVGLEMAYQQMVYLRAGAGEVQQIKNLDDSYSHSTQFNFGLGLQLRNFAIDYAFTDLGDQSEGLYSHVFSIKVGFD